MKSLQLFDSRGSLCQWRENYSQISNCSLPHWRGSAPRLPCVKGAGFFAVLTAKKTEGLTTPPSEIIDFAHLPLHRGGFGAVQTCSFHRIPYAERKLATESGDTQRSYLPTGLTGTRLPAGASPQTEICTALTNRVGPMAYRLPPAKQARIARGGIPAMFTNNSFSPP